MKILKMEKQNCLNVFIQRKRINTPSFLPRKQTMLAGLQVRVYAVAI